MTPGGCLSFSETFTIFFFRTISSMVLKLDMGQQGLEVYKNYINDDSGLTLTYFTARSNLVKIANCACTVTEDG